MTWQGIIIIVFLGAFSIGYTFFPVQSARFQYMLVEWLCVLSGDDDGPEMLEIKYEGLKRDPKAYFERHWGDLIVARFVGIVALTLFILLIKDILIH